MKITIYCSGNFFKFKLYQILQTLEKINGQTAEKAQKLRKTVELNIFNMFCVKVFPTHFNMLSDVASPRAQNEKIKQQNYVN